VRGDQGDAARGRHLVGEGQRRLAGGRPVDPDHDRAPAGLAGVGRANDDDRAGGVGGEPHRDRAGQHSGEPTRSPAAENQHLRLPGLLDQDTGREADPRIGADVQSGGRPFGHRGGLVQIAPRPRQQLVTDLRTERGHGDDADPER
jgi:hypothetical protein